ncbi:MAG TPA: CerR family C-terminal domain-containing protein [Thermoguttaceae bacterium]|nr:CerR family C-terminal domain-containing protein [Thermoguttaceae bacterium]
MICGEAEANNAAINYHFGDKKSLYRAVWRHLLDAADREHPVPGNLPEDRAPSERLESHVRALLNRHFGEGSSWQLESLRSLEHVNPTGLVDDMLSARRGGNRRQMLAVLGELLGDDASDNVIRFCETSVPALCRGDWSASPAPKSYAQGKGTIGTRQIKVLAGRIARFLLAGIEMKVHARDATLRIMNRRSCRELSE